MKKVALLGVAALAALSLAACSSTSSSSSSKTSESSKTEQSSKTATSSSENPEATKFLADYKTFVDSYVAFVGKYKANPNDTALITQLSDMTTKETQMAADAEKFKGDLTADQLVEYTKINGEMLKAAQSLSTVGQ